MFDLAHFEDQLTWAFDWEIRALAAAIAREQAKRMLEPADSDEPDPADLPWRPEPTRD